MKLKVGAFALSTGIISGVGIAVLTIFSLLRGSGLTLGKLVLIFPGYSVSGVGVILGLIYGFIYGLIAGAIFSFLYNALSRE